MDNDLTKILKDLKSDITEIQRIMVEVSTDSDLWIPECEERYKELYFSIETKIHLLEKFNIKLVQVNSYGSLWDYYSYWRTDLQTYQDRREHVRSLYREIEKRITLLLIEFTDSNYDDKIFNTELYLDIEIVPDDFYRQLIDLINECYSKGIYVAVPIFSRKLLESLIVDILKKKYGNKDVEIFFDTKNRKYHSFNKLLETFEIKLPEFITCMPSLEKSFLKEISKYRERGNTTVHVLELDMKKVKPELESNKSDLNHKVITLIRLYINL